MYTQCPHCQTIFGVSEDHLSAAYGRVRCGVCRDQFNARRHLLDEIPSQKIKKVAPQASSSKSEQQAAVTIPAGPEVAEAHIKLPADIPADEIKHIDLPDPVEETAPHPGEATEKDGENTEPATEPEEPADAAAVTEHPVVENSPDNEELDAIFAALDHRLEALTEDAAEAALKPLEKFERGEGAPDNYQDDFGDPESQTEDDIQASIETIFAAAEAELIKTDTIGNNDLPAQEIPLQEFLDSVNVEFLGTGEADQPDAAQAPAARQTEDIFITETGAQEENFDLAANEEADPAHTDKNDDKAPGNRPDREPAFEQEDLPFLLHDDIVVLPVPPRSWPKTAGLSLIIVSLLAALVFQLALFRNVELANGLPAIKPYLESFCQHLPCQFSGKRDVKQIHLTSRDVRTHPKGKNTLLISAIFVNNARFEQPYPDILITLSDLTTTVVAQRRFTPEDYLASQAGGAFQLLKPGKPVHITLEVLDPGNDAVNFQFEFL